MKKIYRRNKIALLAALASVLTTLNAEPSNTSEKSGGELTFDNTLRVMTYNTCRGGTYQGQPLSQSAKMIEYALEKGETAPLGVPVGMFAAKDGYLNINARRDNHFASLCHVLGLPELVDDPKYRDVPARFANADGLMPLLRAAIKTRTLQELSTALTAVDMLFAKVQDYGDYFACEHVREVEAVRWINQSGVGQIPMPIIPGVRPPREGDPLVHAPHLGEHSREILSELGHADEDINALASSGAIGLYAGV